MGACPRSTACAALAVVAVLLFHSQFSWATGGFLGVSAFFTLSGFLITSLLLHDRLGSTRGQLRAFWSRRVRRLLPAAIVTLFGVTVVCGDRRDARPAPRAARRRVRRTRVRRQLALPSRGQSYAELFRAPVAGAALLVARDRGAVLRALSARRRRHAVAGPPAVGAASAPGARWSAGGRHRGLGDRELGLVRERRLDARVLRHRHARGRAPRRRLARGDRCRSHHTGTRACRDVRRWSRTWPALPRSGSCSGGGRPSRRARRGCTAAASPSTRCAQPR